MKWNLVYEWELYIWIMSVDGQQERELDFRSKNFFVKNCEVDLKSLFVFEWDFQTLRHSISNLQIAER